MKDLMQAHPWRALGFSIVNGFVGFDWNWGSSERWGFDDLVKLEGDEGVLEGSHS